VCEIRHPAMGIFSEKKCAIDRHLSTEGSSKLRLWRLFDPQNIHECARLPGGTQAHLPRHRAHSCIFCGSNRRQRRSFGEPSVLKRLSMAHFFSKNVPRSETAILCMMGSESTTCKSGPKSPSRQGAFFAQKVRHRQTFEH